MTARELRTIRITADEANLRNRIVRLAGLYRDMSTSDASDENVDDVMTELFDAVDALRVDALREARK